MDVRSSSRRDCNETTTLTKSAEFATRIDGKIRQVLARDDVTARQKREIDGALAVPGYDELTVEESVAVEK